MTVRAFLRRAVVIGAIAGAAMIYLALVGLVEAFKDRNLLTGIVTLGEAMLVGVPLVFGYRAARVPLAALDGGRTPGLPARLAAGAITGVVCGAMLAAVVLLGTVFELRGVLVRLSAGLIEFLTFGLEPAVGALAQTGISLAGGVAGAVLAVLAPRIRRPLVAGMVAIVLMSMVEPFVRPRLGQLDLGDVAGFLYRSKGMTIPAAILVFVVVAAAAAAWRPARGALRTRVDAMPADGRRWVNLATVAVVVLALLALPQISGGFLSQVLVLVGLYLLLALGLNIVVGYAGLLDLGYVAFFAVGAYLMALLTSPASSLGIGLSFWVALPIVMIGAAATGILIGAPVLRLRGDYLAIVTLGFGEIARILFLSDALKPWLGGTQGILGIPNLSIFGFEFRQPEDLYYPILAFCGLAAFIAFRLATSRVGRAWNAMREDEQVAQATGVNITNYKLLAFALGATLGCLSGALFAVQLHSVFPGSFSILVSITVLAVIILGGMGSIPGVVLGAFVLIGFPELLREFAEYRLLVYGIVLVAMMLLRPEGLLPDVGRRRELHEAEEEEDQYAERAGADVSAPVVTTTSPAA
ncbi:MAG: leucine/isoleucine/valine transporter permease subunit [Chloroflexota bacterium]|nr:leucine/isoleucine/valine transporter permease subunit [Chloroflexota bacterium]